MKGRGMNINMKWEQNERERRVKEGENMTDTPYNSL